MGETKGELIRELGLKEGLAVGLGTMIGAGIFVLSGIAVERAGRAATVSYLTAGMLCLGVALIISELATGMPRAGGSYTFISQALGPLAGSLVGPANWLGLTFATGFYLIASGRYLALFMPILPWAGAIVTGFLFTWLNYRGAKTSGSVQDLVVVLLVAILALFVVLGITQTDLAPGKSFAPYGWGAALSVIGLIIVSFTGFEKISTISEEIKNPGRNLPLAIVGAVIIATILYGSILFVASGLLPPTQVNTQKGLLVEAASLLAGAFGQSVMVIAALLATLSSANAAIMASSRIAYGMGRDRVLPAWFNYAHPRFSTPSRAILVTGAMGTLLALVGRAEILAEISSALFMVSYALLSASVIVMRSAKPSWYRPSFRAPLFPLLPLVTAVLCLSVILTMSAFSRAAGIGLVALSMIWYAAWVRKHAVVMGEIGPLWARERPLEDLIETAETAMHGAKNEVLIPLLEDTDPASLLELATALAVADEQIVVNVLDVKIVPTQTPLEMARTRLLRPQQPGTREYALAQMVAQAAMRGVPMRTLQRAAYGLASGVLATVENRPAVGLILTSWHQDLSASQIYGSPTKQILEKAKCDVAVLRARELNEIRRLLVPIGGGPHARLGLRLARRIAQGDDAELTVLRVVCRKKDLDIEMEMRGLQHVIKHVLGNDTAGVSVRIRVSDDVTEAILQEVEEGDHNLLVIGASNEWLVKSLLTGALPDAVAARAPCSVLMVRRYEPTGISNTRRIASSLRGWK
jgi:amino acid transporter/nucleotide-binding universal stress UspA family protein